MVPRPEHLVDFADRLGAERHGRDGLRSARFNDLLDAALVRDVDDLRPHLACGAGRRSEADELAAGNHGGHAEHHRRRGQDGRAAGDVESHSVNGLYEARAHDTRHGLDHQRRPLLGHLRFMKCMDI